MCSFSYYTKNFEVKEINSKDHYYNYNDDDPEDLLTHDKIPIRKILVANIEFSTTHKDLRLTFASYGKIIDCNLKKKHLEKSYAFITFKYGSDVQRALVDGYNKRIHLDGQYLRVLPAAAWHQPDKNKYTNKKSIISTEKRLAVYNNYSSNNESPITKLNEYCLLHIFGFLPIRDRIRIERVCRYWQIISSESLNLYKNIDSILSTDNWKYVGNAPTLYKILEKFGQYITRVNGDYLRSCNLSNTTLIAIATLCPNIEEINLSNFSFLTSGIKALTKNCTKIKHITIAKSKHNDNAKMKNKKYDKELSALFLKNRNLQYLHLMDDIIDGSCLKHLSTKTITHISLTNLNCCLFFHVISKVQNLFMLNIDRCSKAYMVFEVQALKLNAEKLEKLTITNNNLSVQQLFTFVFPNINNFFKSNNLKNLKYLNLRNTNYSTDDLLFTLGDSLKHQLTYLDISNAEMPTNSGLIWIISSLSNLEHFHMQSMNKNVTDEIFCCGMPKLKTLNCSICKGIRDEGLIKFINNSEKLEKLDVSECGLITNKLIEAAIKYTQHRTNTTVLSINAEGTKVNVTEIKKNSPFLQLKS